MTNYLTKDLLPVKTERLLLRLPEVEEVDPVIRYVNENRDHLSAWEPLRSEDYYTPEFWTNELRRRQNDFYTGEGVSLAVFPRDFYRGPVIGMINFSKFMYGVFQACFLGYSVHYKYQGQGIMYEALEASVDFVFKSFHVHRIMANYMPRNERSGKLLRKLGFVVEGYARDYLQIAGKWEDHILTSKIR